MKRLLIILITSIICLLTTQAQTRYVIAFDCTKQQIYKQLYFVELTLNYNSILPEMSEYLLPRVKIVISCLSMDEPVEKELIRSFISEIIPKGDDTTVLFNTGSHTYIP